MNCPTDEDKKRSVGILFHSTYYGFELNWAEANKRSLKSLVSIRDTLVKTSETIPFGKELFGNHIMELDSYLRKREKCE